MKKQQSAKAVFMVQPTSFGFDKQTAETNAFQQHVPLSHEEVLARVNDEFNRMVASLRAHGIEVVSFKDDDATPKPNAVFPNNWLSMWPDGHVFLYPMATESRRVERTFSALQAVSRHFKIDEVSDLSAAEQEGKHLESTGVMIFDHKHSIVYGSISDRCDEQLFKRHAKLLGYKPVTFHSYDPQGIAVYHTNVLMGVQSTTAVICAEAITDEAERTLVLNTLHETGHEVVEISQDQMAHFCGNVLELRNKIGERFLAMSQTAYDNFTPGQREQLSKDKTLLPFAIPTIETIGGGSVRCMLAEIYLPTKVTSRRAQTAPNSLGSAVAAL